MESDRRGGADPRRWQLPTDQGPADWPGSTRPKGRYGETVITTTEFWKVVEDHPKPLVMNLKIDEDDFDAVLQAAVFYLFNADPAVNQYIWKALRNTDEEFRVGFNAVLGVNRVVRPGTRRRRR